MLIPTFSVRSILTITAACAVVFVVVRFAATGQAWALAMAGAIGSLLVLFALFGVFFATAFAMTRVVRPRSAKRAESPFATDKLPPQIIPPRDPA